MRTPEDFCHWLQGFFEIADAAPTIGPNGQTVPQGLNHVQVDVIRKHLALVFTNVTAPSNVRPLVPGPVELPPGHTFAPDGECASTRKFC